MTAQDDGPGSYAITYDKLEVTRARCQMHPDARFIQIHPDSFLCNAVSCCVLQTYQRRLEIELVTPTPAYARSGSEIVGKLAAGGVVLVLEACVSRVSREHWRRDTQCFGARRRDHLHNKIVVPKPADLYHLLHFHILFVFRFAFPRLNCIWIAYPGLVNPLSKPAMCGLPKIFSSRFQIRQTSRKPSPQQIGT